MLWEVLRARGGALRILRVSALIGCLGNDHLCPRLSRGVGMLALPPQHHAG
ncbi:ceroid lipofuscinosis, neuronal 3, juvenile (Batten, Spielmeyer-Vogt disease), isoform CRA_c [Mus musculus]|nr:ceroid lipofuscinosis, neuronal 3, juvenile (Batten, Spielmeyer-Vogt disease), isoform CRA_c [Mus musculus]